MANQPKFKFTTAQRYATWLHHEKRCWQCEEPLRIAEVTIDHVIPESMLASPRKLKSLIVEYDLPKNFNVNGFENWLPAHNHCNQKKSTKKFRMVPAYRMIFDRLIQRAKAVARTAEAISQNNEKDKIIAKLLVALDADKISLTDILNLLSNYGATITTSKPSKTGSAAFIKLDNGYWLNKDEVAFEGKCSCERRKCVGKKSKVYCYWPSHLSSWVKRKHLYYRCYDEIVHCPRCSTNHRRGDIGRAETCSRPYTDQENQEDLRNTEVPSHASSLKRRKNR